MITIYSKLGLTKLNDEINKKKIITILINILSIICIAVSLIFINRVSPIFSATFTIIYSVLDFVLSFLFIKVNKYNKTILDIYTKGNDNNEIIKGTFVKRHDYITTYRNVRNYEYLFLIDNKERIFYIPIEKAIDLKPQEYTIRYYDNFIIGVTNDENSL